MKQLLLAPGIFNFFLLATQISASKSYATQYSKNVNLPKLVRLRGVSFTEFIQIWGHFGYFGYFDPPNLWVCLQW